jgi:hypothetical protein
METLQVQATNTYNAILAKDAFDKQKRTKEFADKARNKFIEYFSEFFEKVQSFEVEPKNEYSAIITIQDLTIRVCEGTHGVFFQLLRNCPKCKKLSFATVADFDSGFSDIKSLGMALHIAEIQKDLPCKKCETEEKMKQEKVNNETWHMAEKAVKLTCDPNDQEAYLVTIYSDDNSKDYSVAEASGKTEEEAWRNAKKIIKAVHSDHLTEKLREIKDLLKD